MPTFKPVILKGKIHINKKGESNIKILIVHKGQAEYIKTDYYIPPKIGNKETLGADGKIISSHANASFINAKLKELTLSFELTILKLDAKFIEQLTTKQIKQILVGEDITKTDFYSYSKRRINELKEAGRGGTANSYSDSVERLKEFTKTNWLPFDEMDKKFLENFVTHKKKEGKSINSIGVYLRSIRALYNDAMEDLNEDGKELFIKNYPFHKFKIEATATKDRSIDIDILKKIQYIELTGMEQIARDICLLIFYLIGVNVKDLFYCKGLERGRFVYKRAKGKKEYSIKVEPEAQVILDKYKGEKYLLRFADNCAEERGPGQMRPHQRNLYQYKDHRAFNKMLNENLKKIVDIINENHKREANKNDILIADKLSTYYFRYAWGNIARDICKISMDDISAAYGHQDQSLKITKIYVRENLKIIDEANRKVLDALK